MRAFHVAIARTWGGPFTSGQPGFAYVRPTLSILLEAHFYLSKIKVLSTRCVYSRVLLDKAPEGGEYNFVKERKSKQQTAGMWVLHWLYLNLIAD